MKRLLLGILIGLSLAAPSAMALRIASPPTFSGDWDTNKLAQLNQALIDIWNVLNGRYQMDVVTVDPDGSRKGTAGEMVLFDSGTDQLCVNVGGLVWHCVNLS